MFRSRHPLTTLAALAVCAVFPYSSLAAPTATAPAPKAVTTTAKTAPVLVAQALPPVTVAAPTDGYTGLIVDARNLSGILRSPSPALYGPAPTSDLLYPDRSHVPTADEVQDESVVRYYHTEDEARAGVGGANPLVVRAEAVLGYAHDSLQLSAADVAPPAGFGEEHPLHPHLACRLPHPRRPVTAPV